MFSAFIDSKIQKLTIINTSFDYYALRAFHHPGCYIEEIQIINNQLNEKDFEEFGCLLKFNKTLKSFTIKESNYKEKEVIFLIESMIMNKETKIEKLILNDKVII